MIAHPCDLFDRHAVSTLPHAPNVLYLAGRKFGTVGTESQTWASNVLLPVNVCRHFAGSRIVAFSTGCVYPLVSPDGRGCREETPPAPVGEYAQSCLGRERLFEYFSERDGTSVCLYRLNYAVALRYGVLYDIGIRVWRGDPVDLSSPAFNVVWQGDANRYALHALELAASPAVHLNVTGPEMLSTRDVAETFGRLMDKPVTFATAAGAACYLNDATLCHARFGVPHVSADDLVHMQADWIMRGGSSLGKSTHFEVTNGTF
jgi:nucleoside-diphosphate-sugar epimerase